MNVNKLVDTVRGKLQHETYVDFHAIPDPPAGPYRARVPAARYRSAPDDVEVSEPDIVQGDLQLLYGHALSLRPTVGGAAVREHRHLPQVRSGRSRHRSPIRHDSGARGRQSAVKTTWP
jgi:hypothetical protein